MFDCQTQQLFFKISNIKISNFANFANWKMYISIISLNTLKAFHYNI